MIRDFPRKAIIPSASRINIAASSENNPIVRSPLAFLLLTSMRACRLPIACICRGHGPMTRRGVMPRVYHRKSSLKRSRKSLSARSARPSHLDLRLALWSPMPHMETTMRFAMVFARWAFAMPSRSNRRFPSGALENLRSHHSNAGVKRPVVLSPTVLTRRSSNQFRYWTLLASCLHLHFGELPGARGPRSRCTPALLPYVYE